MEPATTVNGDPLQSECQNCATIWDSHELFPVEDLTQRVAPGEPMTSGECPECGALCHEIDSRS